MPPVLQQIPFSEPLSVARRAASWLALLMRILVSCAYQTEGLSAPGTIGELAFSNASASLASSWCRWQLLCWQFCCVDRVIHGQDRRVGLTVCFSCEGAAPTVLHPQCCVLATCQSWNLGPTVLYLTPAFPQNTALARPQPCCDSLMCAPLLLMRCCVVQV